MCVCKYTSSLNHLKFPMHVYLSVYIYILAYEQKHVSMRRTESAPWYNPKGPECSWRADSRSPRRPDLWQTWEVQPSLPGDWTRAASQPLGHSDHILLRSDTYNCLLYVGPQTSKYKNSPDHIEVGFLRGAELKQRVHIFRRLSCAHVPRDDIQPVGIRKKDVFSSVK